MGGAMLSKSLIQFSVDGWGCVPSLLFGLRSNCQPVPPPETPGHSQASLGQSLVESLLLGPGAHKVFLCPPTYTVLCKFWQLYGGVNGDLLQEGLCHTQVCCTQSSCPCSSPLLTRNSSGDTQTPDLPLEKSVCRSRSKR